MGKRKRYRSALRSERYIRDAYIALAEAGERISVTSICHEAKLNRSTFYAHYESVEQLEEQLVTSLMEGMAQVMRLHAEPSFVSNPEPMFQAVGRYVAENRSLLKLLLTSNASASFVNQLRAYLHSAVSESNLANEVYYDYLAGGLFSIYRVWVLGLYGDTPIEDVSHIAAQWARQSLEASS